VLTPLERDRTVDLAQGRKLLGLDERLKAIPSWAQVRGFLFKMTSDAVAAHGAAAVAAHRQLSPARASRWFFRMYPVGDYLEDVAAAAMVISPEDPALALPAIWAPTTGYAPLFNARFFLELLGKDVFAVARWLEGHRHFFANYGRWRMEVRDDRYFIMHYFDECIWIDSAHRGGMQGLVDACGVKGTVDVDLDDPFNGRLHVRWQAP
jgi:uncharacterized protein (TIGR02265 family)